MSRTKKEIYQQYLFWNGNLDSARTSLFESSDTQPKSSQQTNLWDNRSERSDQPERFDRSNHFDQTSRSYLELDSQSFQSSSRLFSEKKSKCYYQVYQHTSCSQNVIVCNGKQLRLIVCANKQVDIQWQVSTDQGRSFKDIPGEIYPKYGFRAKTCDNGNIYRPILFAFSRKCSLQCQVKSSSPFLINCEEEKIKEWKIVDKIRDCSCHHPDVYICQEVQVIVTCKGKRGKTGPVGAQGEVGPQGIQGEVGPRGAQGEVGPQGVQGEVGPQGAQGEVGPQGVQGEIGPQGSQGVQGEIGPQGPEGGQGEIGPQGPEGPQGEIGPQGPEGGQGEVGPQGPEGGQGEVGPQGPEGPQGSSGNPNPGSIILFSTGTDTTNGVDGTGVPTNYIYVGLGVNYSNVGNPVGGFFISNPQTAGSSPVDGTLQRLSIFANIITFPPGVNDLKLHGSIFIASPGGLFVTQTLTVSLNVTGTGFLTGFINDGITTINVGDVIVLIFYITSTGVLPGILGYQAGAGLLISS